MKIETRLITHRNGKRYFHFWLIPSIEADYEHFQTKDYGEHKWLHIYFSWLVWSLDLEWNMTRKKATIKKRVSLTEKQLKCIEESLANQKPRRYSLSDIRYDLPEEPCAALVISDWRGRDDVVLINCGYYSDGHFYFHPIKNGLVSSESKMLNNVIAYIKI